VALAKLIYEPYFVSIFCKTSDNLLRVSQVSGDTRPAAGMRSVISAIAYKFDYK
jgi:hypothetical protein